MEKLTRAKMFFNVSRVVRSLLKAISAGSVAGGRRLFGRPSYLQALLGVPEMQLS